MKTKPIVRYELLINGEHEGYYMNVRSLNHAIDSFYLCKPKWYECEEDYEKACSYRENARVQVVTHILNKGE